MCSIKWSNTCTLSPCVQSSDQIHVLYPHVFNQVIKYMYSIPMCSIKWSNTCTLSPCVQSRLHTSNWPISFRLYTMKWSRDHLLTCVRVYRLNVIIDRLKLLLVRNVVRGCSQLTTSSLVYSFSWILPHPESVHDDDPAISSGVIAISTFVFSPWKLGQIKNLGIMSCISIRCTYDTNLQLIQPLLQELQHFVFLVWTPWWPRQESDWTEIWSVSYRVLLSSGTYVQSFGSIALSWFSKLAAWRAYLKSDRAEIW
jgi:hypothetical protein